MIRRAYRILFILISCFFTLNSVAQTVTVKNAITDEAVPNVHVLNQSNSGETSNDSGVVKLDRFNSNDTLIFQHTSFKVIKKRKKDLLKDGLTIYMEEKIIMLDAAPEVIGVKTIKEVFTDENSPFTIEKLDSKTIQQINPQTSADMLQASGEVLVQKSQSGGGSPMIRGFEASRVLLVIDGVRMNNAIYRSGHLQNAITIDNSILDKTEIFFGPGSVAYGSDALGGVVHFHTKTPLLSKGDSIVNDVNSYVRYSSANQEKSAHIDFSIGAKKIGFLTSASVNDFGDIKMGKVRNHGYRDFGKITNYTGTFNDIDSMFINNDPNLHINSGYKQMDVLEKIHFKPNDNLNFTLNIQYSTSSEIPRYDRLTEYKGNLLKFAEWKYGPQKRFLSSFQTKFRKKEGKLFNEGNITIAYQKIDEDRINRKFGSVNENTQKEDVFVYSANIDFNKEISETAHLFYGIEGTFNDVFSVAESKDVSTGIVSSAATRYPDAGSSMTTLATYTGYKKELSEKAILTFGIRYSQINLQATYKEGNSFYTLPFSKLEMKNGALSGSAGISITPSATWKINIAAATGFKSPNLDDASKVREKGGFVTVPNDQLTPEYAYNSEISISKSFNEEAIVVQGAFFYTYLDNAIVTRNYQLNGSDSLLYEGDMARIQTNLNATKAQIYGMSAKITVIFSESISFNSNFNYTVGEDLQDHVSMAHIAPIFGRFSLNFENNKWQSQLFVNYNGWKRIENYAPGSTDNPALATADGTPAWHTININSSYNMYENLQFQFGIENILDHHYKPFASGISGFGRNFKVTLRAGI